LGDQRFVMLGYGIFTLSKSTITSRFRCPTYCYVAASYQHTVPRPIPIPSPTIRHPSDFSESEQQLLKSSKREKNLYHDNYLKRKRFFYRAN
jgi:hypothetical protein